MKKLIASTAFAAMAIVGTAGAATAQSPIVANNLVGLNISGNQVNVVDVADVNANVAVPVGIAANICNVNVAVLADVMATGAPCDATSTQRSQQALEQAQRFMARN